MRSAVASAERRRSVIAPGVSRSVPDGRYLYAANGPSNDVSVVNTETMAVEATVSVGERPWGVAVIPN